MFLIFELSVPVVLQYLLSINHLSKISMCFLVIRNLITASLGLCWFGPMFYYEIRKFLAVTTGNSEANFSVQDLDLVFSLEIGMLC